MALCFFQLDYTNQLIYLTMNVKGIHQSDYWSDFIFIRVVNSVVICERRLYIDKE